MRATPRLNPLAMVDSPNTHFKALTAEGKKRLDPIAADNGRDLDGTPILQKASDIVDATISGQEKIERLGISGN